MHIYQMIVNRLVRTAYWSDLTASKKYSKNDESKIRDFIRCYWDIYILFTKISSLETSFLSLVRISFLLVMAYDLIFIFTKF